MKNKIKEANKLPYIFDHLEFRNNNAKNMNKKDINYNTCTKHQTDFYIFGKPEKNLVRLI